MFNPLISPEQYLMIKRAEVAAQELDFEVGITCTKEEIEALAMYQSKTCNALTIIEEEYDLTTDYSPFDKYLPNDGTSAFERRLRKQGLRKKDDEEWPNMEVWVELFNMKNRKAERVHILRTKRGDSIKEK